ncbi:HNH endonuclease signature motif containing protein [Pedococcus sp.]|uniref:HNH endonuclease signature motif containing protein n=1 Tax=Pedococcus sp. TaxID=2860345 RepID=UPI002E115879|nr:HNH endonuclease signature motif containing protein [Pedococcus sp.]
MFELDRLGGQLQAGLARVAALGESVSGARPASVTSEDWVALTGACQEAINVLAAIQTVALAQVAATEDRLCEDGTVVEEFRGLGHQRLDAPALVHDVLGLTASGATGRVATAVDLVTRHPRVLEAMGAGRLDGYRAAIVAQELAEATPEVCVEVVRRLGDHLGTEPGGALRRRTRRLLAAVDADLVRQQAQRARSERSLRRSAFEVGVDEWTALVPVEQSRSAWSVVDGLARSYVVQGRCARIDQARADALMDLIHARATGRVGIQVTVPASTMAPAVAFAGRAGDPDVGTVSGDALVPVTGFGMPGVTHVRASWLASVAAGAAHGGQGQGGAAPGRAVSGVRVVACNDHTGALTSLPLAVPVLPVPTTRIERPTPGPSARPASAMAEAGDRHAAYRPPPWLVDFVKARDGHCRFPGCTVSARFCDIDHVVAWPAGATDPANLACLCRRHHRVKQRPRWRVEMEPGAVLVWTDPCGRVRPTMPLDQLQLDSAAVPVAPAPAKSAEATQPTEATGSSAPTNAAAPTVVTAPTEETPRTKAALLTEATAPTTRAGRGCMLPSVLEEEIVLCLGRHHMLARARLRQRRHISRQPARPGTSSLDPPPF